MKNKLLKGICIMGIVFLTACSTGEGTVSTDRDEIFEEKVDKEEEKEIEEKESEKESEEKADTSASVSEVPTQESVTFDLGIYEDFLADKEKLYYHQVSMNYPDAATRQAGVTLTQLTESFFDEYWALEQAPDVEYAYLDCGNDGEMELAVRFVGMGIYSPGDDSTLVYIIKEIDGCLELCHVYETWARSDTSVNRYGYVSSGGSNGSSNHGAKTGYIDASGHYNHVYYTEEEMDINQLYFAEGLSLVPEVAAKKEYAGNIGVCTTTFEEISSMEAYYNVERFYSYYVSDVEGDIYSDGVYKEIFEEAGVVTYLPEEIESMIAAKEASLGITEEIKTAPLLDWEKLFK